MPHIRYLLLVAVGVLFVGWLVSLSFGPTDPPPVVTQHANGSVASIVPMDAKGQIHGTQKYFTPDGRLSGMAVYSHGRLLRHVEYWPSGRMKTEIKEGAGYQLVYEEYPDKD